MKPKYIIIDLLDDRFKYLESMGKKGTNFTCDIIMANVYDNEDAAKDDIKIILENATKVWYLEIKPVYLHHK